MKNKALRILSVVLSVIFVLSVSSVLSASNISNKNISKIPIQFIPNMGQIKEKEIIYYGFSGNAYFYFSSNNVLYNFPGKNGDTKESVSLNFLNANKSPKIETAQKTQSKFNYFVGNDRKNHISNIPAYLNIVYKNLYKGIDLLYTSKENKLESEFIVAPKHSAKSIKLKYEGVTGLNVDKKGNLVVTTPNGSFIEEKPFAFQEIKGKRKIIDAKYKLLSKDTYTFSVAKYDSKYPLVIDPTLSFSTFIGGTLNEVGRSVKVDSSGNIYIFGDTDSTGLPENPNSKSAGTSLDAFLAKFNTAGTLEFTTYLGGTSGEYGFCIAFDSSENIYAVGRTNSTDFPTTEGARGDSDTTKTDGFLVKFSKNSGAVLYSTYFGGNGNDEVIALDIDSQNNIFLGGSTSSTNFPTTEGSYDTTFNDDGSGNTDAFVSKLNSSHSLIYSSYFGGGVEDRIKSMKIDNYGSVYIGGYTKSLDFPTKEAFNPTYSGDYDIFVAKLDLNRAGTAALDYSTFLGGVGDDKILGLAVNSQSKLYVTGYTTSGSTHFQKGSDEVNKGPLDAFIAKFDPDTSGSGSLVYSSYLGGSGIDIAHTIAVDSKNNIYVAGETASTNFPTQEALFSSNQGSSDVFLTKYNDAGNTLTRGYSTYFGGSLNDICYSISLDSSGNIYLTGDTVSSNFYTSSGAYDTSQNGNDDAFLIKFIVSPPSPESFTVSPESTTSLRYSWTDKSNNETGFRIVDPNDSSSARVKVLVAANTIATVEPGLGTNNAYTRKVEAYNSEGSSTSEGVAVTKYTSIEASAGATFEGITDTQITIHSSNAPSNLTEGLSGILFTNTTIGTSSGWIKSNTWTNNSGLSANTKYNFTIATRNGDGTITATIDAGSPNTLAKPVAASFSEVSTTAITANWTGNSQLTEYYCENITANKNSGWINALKWTSKDLEKETEYEFRVKGRKTSTEETEWVSLGKQKTIGYGSANISGLESGDSCSPTPEFKVNLTADPPVSVERVEVDGIKKDFEEGASASGINIQALTAISLTIKLKEPLTAGTHDIKISIKDAKGTIYVVELKGLKVASAGSEGTSAGPSLAYPNPYNPSTGDLKITYNLSKDTGIKICIFDTSGRLVWQNRYISGVNGGKAGYNDVPWNGKDLSGIILQNDFYLCRIINSDTGKLINTIKIVILKG